MRNEERIQGILERKRLSDAAVAESERLSTANALAIERAITDAPARWLEHWQLFRSTTAAINERLKSADLQIELVDVAKDLKRTDLAVFQIYLLDHARRSPHSMTATVADTGDITVVRRLPDLADSRVMDGAKLAEATIEDFLLLFVENAQGARSPGEMMADK